MKNIKNPFEDYANPFSANCRPRINNTNATELKEKYNLSYIELDRYTTNVLSAFGTDATVDDLEDYIRKQGHQVYNVEVKEPIEKRIFNTTQNAVVLPTKELIKMKNTDFRVLLGLSIISNVDNFTISGANTRYCSIRKVDRNMEKLCKCIGITPSQFRKHLRALLKHNTDEFKLIEKEYNGEKVLCYEINYTEGGFITIPYAKVESILVGGSNNCIKLYANLLWLCTKDGEFIEKHISQETLLELMGLSPSTRRIITIATEWLEGANLIKTEKRWESETILVDGMPVGSSPKSKIYYSIVTE